MDHTPSRHAGRSGRPVSATGQPRARAPRALPARPLTTVLLALFLVPVLGACGNRGSLYLPDEAPLAAGNPAARGQPAQTSQTGQPAAPGDTAGAEAASDAAEEDDDSDEADATERGGSAPSPKPTP